VEALEGRDCPSAPQITALAAPVQTGNTVLLNTTQTTVTDPGISLSLSAAQGTNCTVTVSGQVFGTSQAGGLTVTLSGVVSGSVTTNADGTFTYTGAASALGQIKAAVTDDWGVTVNSSTMLSDNPPTIVNFQAINNGNNSWTFMGQVQGEDVAGLVVTLRGLASLNNNNVSATVQADGSFSYTITLAPGENGCVTAECIDWWGQASNEATAYVWS